MPHPRLEIRWQNGEPAVGGWVNRGGQFSLGLYGMAGYDYVAIDCQHSLTDESTAATMVAAASPDGPALVVRVSKNDPALIGRLVDAGADGIIVPLVNDAEAAAAAVAAVRYPPRGVRSYGPIRPDLQSAGPRADDRVSVFVMIETATGLANADRIAAVDGLAGIYVGPSDLSIGLGFDPRDAYRTDQLVEPVERIRIACERAGVILGMHQLNADTAQEWIPRGVKLVSLGSDANLFLTAARGALEQVRSGQGVATTLP